MFDDSVRPRAEYPVYPPYHTGDYLEEYFYKHYDGVSKDRQYIDVFWTNLYCNEYHKKISYDIQTKLNGLDPNEKYFTIVQHDDGIREKLPKDTLLFSAGGLQKGENIIPIPLICSPIPEFDLTPKKPIEKDILCSFIGSYTHSIRMELYQYFQKNHYDNNEYAFMMFNWTPNIPFENHIAFINYTKRSKFTLCPRGYGPTSFRLYESFQLNSVPVYISDDHYLPFTDRLTWEEFCVIITPGQIKYLDEILKSIDDDKYYEMLLRGKEVWKEHFTMEGLVRNIIVRI